MTEQDSFNVTGELELILRDAQGDIVEQRIVPNLVVTTGKNFIASRMSSASSSVMSHMAIGTNSTAAAASDTTLGTEAGRVALGTAGGTPTANVVAFTATFPAGTGTGAIVEAGILNASSAGTLLCRTTFAVINKGASDSLTINWNLTIN